MATLSITAVLSLPELFEMILLDDSIPMTQLFLLQRVNKEFKSKIEGSGKLRRKMFLRDGRDRLKPQELLAMRARPLTALFNPLMCINHRDPGHSPLRRLFRYFELDFSDTDNRPLIGVILRSARSHGEAQWRLPVIPGCSWGKLEFCKVPLELEFRCLGDGDQFASRIFFAAGEDTSMVEGCRGTERLA